MGRSPFIGDKPHESISLCFYGDETGLRMWNNPNDPMPIKTTNMAGLQKWEETDDYIIYLCKDATMTVVQNYVTGTFQEFQERKALIEASQELMKSYVIQWSTQDSIDLINEINNEALAKLEATPMLLTENDGNKIQVLSERAVPVTYECCFRMDKKSGEIYIGEGYEYYIKNIQNFHTSNSVTRFEPSSVYQIKKIISDKKAQVWDDVFINKSEILTEFNSYTTKDVFTGGSYSIYTGSSNSENTIHYTKTSTPKPFVKSVMPSGKLAFVTPATSDTRSFVMKDFKSIRFYHCSNFYNWDFETAQIVRSDADNNTKIYDVAISKTCRIAKRKPEEVVRQIDMINVGKTGGTLTFSWRRQPQDAPDGTISFTQLLIYKANLTETELKAENAKTIRLR